MSRTEGRGPVPGVEPAVRGIRRSGPSALLVEVADHAAAGALAAWVREVGPPCRDVVPGARTVLLDGLAPEDVARVGGLLAGWPGAPDHGDGGGPRGDGRAVEIPVVYDGEDLGRVADLWSTTTEEVVRRHTGLELVSAFCGFAPGFSYLAGLPEELAVPRLATPRPRVPAGAVAVADRWCAVYPSASPGGWLLLGRTDVPVWDAARQDGPALLPPGTRVRFVAA